MKMKRRMQPKTKNRMMNISMKPKIKRGNEMKNMTNKM